MGSRAEMKADRTPLSPASSGPYFSSDVLRADWLLIAVTLIVAGAVVTLAIVGCVFTQRQRRRRSFQYRGRNNGALCPASCGAWWMCGAVCVVDCSLANSVCKTEGKTIQL